MGCGVSSRHRNEDDDDSNTLVLTVTYNNSTYPLVASAMRRPGGPPKSPRSVHWNDERLAEPLCPTPMAQTPSQGELDPEEDDVGPDSLWLDASPNGEDAGQRRSETWEEPQVASPSLVVVDAEIAPNGEDAGLQRGSVSFNFNDADKLQVSMLSPASPEGAPREFPADDAEADAGASASIVHWIAHTTVVSLFTALRLTHGNFRPVRPVGAIGALLSAWSTLPSFADPTLDPFTKPLTDTHPPLSSIRSESGDQIVDCANSDGGEEEVSSASGSFRCLPRAESFREEQLLGRDRPLELTLFAKGLADAVLTTRANAERAGGCVLRPPCAQAADQANEVAPATVSRGPLFKSMFLTTSLSPSVLAAWDAVHKGADVEYREVGCIVRCAFPLSVALQTFGVRHDSPPKFAKYFFSLLETESAAAPADERNGSGNDEGEGMQ